MKFETGQKVKFKNKNTKYGSTVFSVYGYANPGYDELIYLIDSHNRIITVDEAYLELVLESLEYRGYKTTPAFSEESQVYHGHIEGIRDLVTWESDIYDKCEEEFHNAVDDYEEFKESIG